jgi:hypothetical protein
MKRERYVPGMSGPYALHMPSLNELARYWLLGHSPRNPNPQPPEVCVHCGKPGDLVLRYTGRHQVNDRKVPNAVAFVQGRLQDTWAVWCRACVNAASAKKVSKRERSQRAFEAMQKDRPLTARSSKPGEIAAAPSDSTTSAAARLDPRSPEALRRAEETFALCPRGRCSTSGRAHEGSSAGTAGDHAARHADARGGEAGLDSWCCRPDRLLVPRYREP